MTRALVFPGQGSQAVGMGRTLADAFAPARHLFQEVDDALDRKLFRLICDGPESELTLTENAQPALMAVSLAAMRAIESEGNIALAQCCAYVAGHSLGEYSALAAAGALAVADAARLLRLRGRAMQKAVPVGEGAMAALLGADLDGAKIVAERAAAETGGVCVAANDNAPGQVVVSGTRAAVERAVALGPEHGARRAVLLPVSAPFHSPLMTPAADAMAEALAAARIAPPAVPLVANVTAAEVSDPDTIRRLLVEQVTGMVRWRETVQYLKTKGVDRIAEVGAGSILAGLVKRIDREIVAESVGTPEDVERFLKSL